MQTKDSYNREKSISVARMLLKSVGNDPSKIPQEYASALTVDYSETGVESWLDILPKLELANSVDFAENDESVEKLLEKLSYVDTSKLSLPPKEDITSIREEAFSESSGVEDFSEIDSFFDDFAEGDDLAAKMEEFLGKTIATVYTSGLDRVSDSEGNPPSEENNYLLNEDGTMFSGKFYDDDDIFSFKIMEETPENWVIEYKLDNPKPGDE